MAGMRSGHPRRYYLGVGLEWLDRLRDTRAIDADFPRPDLSLNAPETQSAETIPVFQKLWVVSRYYGFDDCYSRSMKAEDGVSSMYSLLVSCGCERARGNGLASY
jgi:hypothetical protein